MFSVEVPHGAEDQHGTDDGRCITTPNKNVDVTGLCRSEFLKEKDAHTAYISESIGYVHDESHRAYILKGCNQPVEEHAVERNVAHVQARTHQDHPQGRADGLLFVQECTCSDEQHAGHDDDVIDHQRNLVVFDQHDTAHNREDGQGHRGFGFCKDLR